MCKVIMFGTGNLSKLLEKSISPRTEIVAYADNNKNKWDQLHNNKKIINPKDIKKYDYDFILIGSQYNQEIYEQLLELHIDKKYIFQYSKFIEKNYDYVKYDLNRALENENLIETFVTGISYVKAGFDEKSYNKYAVNLARGSQDLYYDYKLVKYLLNKKSFSNLKEIIIGLSYYSFQYDLSLSAMKNKVISYFGAIGEQHNVQNIDKLMDGIKESDEISKSIFDYVEGSSYIRLQWDETGGYAIIDEEIGKKQAEIDCRKDYPETVKENINIFRDYLEFLIKKNIKPIVVVFPASKYYTKYFSKKIEEEFCSIINNFKEKYKFKYLDYFRSELFTDDDFKDVSHLNVKGAIKFTDILNKNI